EVGDPLLVSIEGRCGFGHRHTGQRNAHAATDHSRRRLAGRRRGRVADRQLKMEVVATISAASTSANSSISARRLITIANRTASDRWAKTPLRLFRMRMTISRF